MRRLFFALWPASHSQEEIDKALRPQVQASGGRAIPARNLHVTLIFLGSVPEPRVADVISCADQVRACGPFELEFDHVEVWKRSGVLSLVARSSPRVLGALVDGLRFNLLNAQFEIRQEHEYVPHVTLARDARRRVQQVLVEPIRWCASEFALVQSETTPSGSKYTTLHNWLLIQ
jgi:RNA 2',3'-cyclic 3'-phosphodiesterase